MPGTVACDCGLTFASIPRDDPRITCPNCGRRLPQSGPSGATPAHNDFRDEFAQYASDADPTTDSWSFSNIVKACFGLLLFALGAFFFLSGGLILLAGILAFNPGAVGQATVPLVLGVLLLRGRARLRKKRVRSLLERSVPTDEGTDSVELTEAEINLAFDEAIALERRGDWQEAISLYEELAKRLAGLPNAEYALNCANRLRERMNSS